MVLPNLGRSVMSDLQFSRAEIERLARKLDSQESQLTDREKQLLLAIFAAARKQVRSGEARDSGGGPTLTSLREQLGKAFMPDEGNDFVLRDPDIDA
jgi:hypothetical protein